MRLTLCGRLRLVLIVLVVFSSTGLDIVVSEAEECNDDVALEEWPESDAGGLGEAAKEFVALDSARGGALVDWAHGGVCENAASLGHESGQDDGNCGAISKLVVLAGRSESHWAAIRGALAEWNPGPLARDENFLRINGVDLASSFLSPSRRRTFASDKVAAWLSSRTVGAEFPWSVAFVSSAQLLDAYDVNEFVLSFSAKSRCTVPASDLDARCGNLLVVLSTDFGAECLEGYLNPEINGSDSNNGDAELDSRALGPGSRKKLEDAALRAARLAWGTNQKYRGITGILRNARRLIISLFGPLSADRLRALVKYQSDDRLKRRAAIAASRPVESPSSLAECTNDGIDTSVFASAGFVGQEIVIQQVIRALDSVRSGLKTSSGPLVFLFAGPAGLGKTFLAQLVASAYHCGMDTTTLRREHRFLQVDMVNYQDDRAIDGFVDPSPGLQGSGLVCDAFSSVAAAAGGNGDDEEGDHEGSQDNNAGRIVILLDEIEKSHQSLLKKMLLPMLDDNGHVQCKKSGRRFPTKDAIFILTTNCFGDAVSDALKTLSSSNANENDISNGDEQTYNTLVKRLAITMHDNNAKCRDAHPSDPNPFASGPLQRRLMAGHALANRNGMFLFLPPSPAQTDALVLNALEALNDSLEEGGRMLFYSKRVLKWLQRRVLRDTSERNLATVAPFVESNVVHLLVDAKKGAKMILLVTESGDALEVYEWLDPVDECTEGDVIFDQSGIPKQPPAQRKHNQTIKDPDSGSSRASLKPSHSLQTSAQADELDIEKESSPEPALEPEIGISTDLERSVDFRLSMGVQEAFDIFVSAACAVAFLVASFYLFVPAVFTAVKLVLCVTALGVAMLTYFFPVIGWYVVKALWELAKILYKWRKFVIPGSAMLYLCLLAYKRRKKSAAAILAERELARLHACVRKLEHENIDLRKALVLKDLTARRGSV